MATRLVLVRHGESRAVVDRMMGGHASCRGLTELGVRQAEALRDRWLHTGEVTADAVYASILPRAVETATIVLPALGTDEVVQDCNLCEIHAGEADELTWDEYESRYGFDQRAEPHRPIAPGGESRLSFQARVSAALDGLIAAHPDQSIVVFCHGGVIGCATYALAGTSMAEQRSWYFLTDNTAITEWIVDSEANANRLVRLNDAAHLVTLR